MSICRNRGIRIRGFFIPLILALLLSWAFTGCDFSPNAPETTSLDLTQPWIIAAPTEVGMNADVLSIAVSEASKIPRILSLLVVRDGKLVLEEYFHGNHADSLNDVRSVTKSIVSTLVGVALKEGLLVVSMKPWAITYIPTLLFWILPAGGSRFVTY